MVNKVRWPSIRKLLSGGGKSLYLLVLAIFIYSATAQARICFLPGGICPGDAGPKSVTGTTGYDNPKAPQGGDCTGFNLTQIKCKGQLCEEGWNCESCTNAQGTFYKCTPKPTPPGYTPGLEKCQTACQKYTWNGFTGNQINGRCDEIPDYTATKPSPCRTYITPDYVCGIKISGANVSDMTKDNGDCKVCYTNIIAMSGYTTTKPASCTTYNSKRNGLGSDKDTMCYTAGSSIGENFSTVKRDSDAFTIETQYGSDTFIALNGGQTKKNTEACYRATGCNTANGWLKASDVDGSKFEYLEKMSDGITCRKAIACKTSNQWFNNDTVGKYKNIYFTTEEETRSGLTCYRATGCYSKAYTSQPDARYFKFEKQSSNNKNCWTVTGKADNAYVAADKKSNFFDYTEATAYLNGTTTQVTYYIVNKDNGRNGCMQYAYEGQPDAKYFASASQTQYSNGSTTAKTCWNITGKGTYAYAENDKVGTHFAYDEGKEGYLNGTSTKVKYFDVTGCGAYAYTSQPDAKYFSFNNQTQKKGGVNTNLTCWNITGKGAYAYAENEKIGTHFAYDAGAEGYLNGTSTKVKYFDVTGCGTYAYPTQPNNTYFTFNNKTQKKGGVNTDLTCWNTTGCSTYSYTSSPDTRFFTVDSATNKKNGVNTDLTCWHATGKATNAYDSAPDGTYFASTSQTAYKNGTSTQMTYWIVDGCGTYAYTSAQDTKYFANDSQTKKKNGSATDITCYRVTGCGSYAYATAQDTSFFANDSATRKKNGSITDITCYRVTGCGGNAYATAQDTTYFNNDSATRKKNGENVDVTCYRVIGCGGNAYTSAQDTSFFVNDSATRKKNGSATDITCYRVTGCGGNAYTSAQDTTYFANDSATKKKNGTTTNITCYRVTGCGGYAYDSTPNSSYFTSDSATRKKNGTATNVTCYRATGCASGAATSTQDTSIFTVDNNTLYKNGTSSEITCYRATGCAITDTKPGACKTYSTSTQSGVTCYYGVGTTGANDCTTTKPTCKTWTAGKDTNGNTVYYSISEVFGSDCTTSPTSCYNYSNKKDTDSVTWYYNPKIIASGATATKPTYSGCKSWLQGAGTNGTTCYWNVSDELTKSALEQKCGTCGYKTRTASCNASGAGWSYSGWNTCTETDKEEVSQTCGCGGTQTRTATCSADGRSWIYSGWSGCSNECTNSQYCDGNATSGTCKSCPSVTAYNSSTCYTAEDGTKDVCGEQNYKYACTSNQYCNSGTCTNCPSSGYNLSTCYTKSNGTDVCGNPKYTYACSSNQYCNSGTCTNCPSVTAYNASTCYTAEDGKKDACGNQNYKYACTSDQKCSGGSCVAKGCSDYNSDYVDSCSAVSCSSSNTSTYTTCTPYYPRTGLTCYIKSTEPCNCTTQSAQTSMHYSTASSTCTMGKDDPDDCGYDNTCTICADNSSWKDFDGAFCNDCDTTTYPITGSCPSNCNCSSCRDGANAGTYHYKVDSAKSGYTVSGNGKSCGIRDLKWYDGSTTIWADGGSSSRSCYNATGYGWEDYWWVKETWNGSDQGKPNVSISTSGDILSNVYMSNDYDTSDGYRLYFTINDNPTTSSRESTVTITLDSDTSKKIYLEACQNAKTCNWTGYLDDCPSNCNCSPKTDCGVTKYKIDSAKSGYYVNGDTCSACPSYTAYNASTCYTTPTGSADVCGNQNYKYTCSNGSMCCGGNCYVPGNTTTSYNKSTCVTTTTNCMLNTNTCQYTEFCSTSTSNKCKSGETCDGNGNCVATCNKTCSGDNTMTGQVNCTGYKERTCTCNKCTGQYECTSWVTYVEGRNCFSNESCIATTTDAMGNFQKQCESQGKSMKCDGSGHMSTCCWCVTNTESCTPSYYDAASGRYCRITNYGSTSGSCSTSNRNYYSGSQSGYKVSPTVAKYGNVSGIGGVLMLDAEMWWSASGACNAVGGSLLSRTEALNNANSLKSFIGSSYNAVWLSDSYPSGYGDKTCEASTFTYQGTIGHKNRNDETMILCVM